MAKAGKTLFLDMDDVLVACSETALRAHGWVNYEESRWPYGIGRNITEALRIGTGTSITMGEFWGAFDREWWANLPKLPTTDALLDMAEGLFGWDNIYILTAGACAAGAAGKIDWIHQHLPSVMHRRYIIAPNKGALGAKGRLLIDDCEDNCVDFMVGGGEAVYFPKPWNMSWPLVGCGQEIVTMLESVCKEFLKR